MGRTREAKAIIVELKKRIEQSENIKQGLIKYLQNLRKKYLEGRFSRRQYLETIYKKRKRKDIREWIEYYDEYIGKCEKEAKQQRQVIIKKRFSVIFFSLFFIFLFFMAGFYIQPSFTGFLVQEAPEIITEANATITTTQHQAILGQPVKWKKTVSLDDPKNFTIILPYESKNIVVKKITKSYSEEIKEETLLKEDSSPSQEESSSSEAEEVIENRTNVTTPVEIEQNESYSEELKEETLLKEDSSPSQEESSSSEAEEVSFSITGGVIGVERESSILRFLRNIARLTGRVIEEPSQEIEINDTATEYEIEYETPAPYSIEEPTATGKILTIIGPETVHYENVLVFTTITETSQERIKIYRTTDGIRESVQITSYIDENNNGLIDKIEWVVPDLSNQTYELIIEITKAEHLDSNKDFISDIYEEVKALDDVWSETIPSSDYIRVTFEQELDSSRDITIYPRIVSGTPRIEVYEVGGTELIAEFTSINSNQYNKVFLTNLIGTQDTFDLRILDGSVEIDHIIDPTQLFFEDWETGDFNDWSNSNYIIATDQAHGGLNSSKCQTTASTGLTCDMYSTVSLDTSSASEVNVTFWFRELAVDPANDANLQFNDSDGAWDEITILNNVVAETWEIYSYASSDAQYLHSGFAIRFYAALEKTENLWLDDINVSAEIAELPDASPTVTLNSPEDNANFSSTIDFNCTASDDINLVNVSLYGNWTGSWLLNDTNSTPVNATPVIFSKTITSNGYHAWNCYACDNKTTAQCSFATANRTFTVDATNPTVVSLDAPENNSVVNSGLVDFNFTAIDNLGLINCTLYTNFGGWAANETVLNPANNTETNITINPPGGVFIWNILCYDIVNRSDWYTDNYTVTVDESDPTATLGINPVDTYNSSSPDITFDFKCSDNVENDYIQLWGNWSTGWHANYTNSSPENDTWMNITVNNIGDGYYEWGVFCNDSATNEDWTANRTLTVDTTPPYFIDGTPANQTSYNNESLIYDVNATDAGIGLDSFSIDDTTNFSIVSSTGVITTLWSLNVTEVPADIESPKWFDNSTNGTYPTAGTYIEHRVRWTDLGLSGYIFSFDNGTGTFANDSWVSMENVGWQTVWEITPDSSFADALGRNFRNVVPASESPYDGTKIRITVEADATGSATLQGASIGQMTTDDDMDNPINGTFKRITWDTGNNGTTVSAGQQKVSDELTFDFDKTKRYGIHLYMTSRDNWVYDSSGADGVYWNNGAANDTAVQTVSYSLLGDISAVATKLEVYVAGTNWSNVSKVVNSTEGSTIRWQVYANDTASPTNLNATDIFQYDTTVSDAIDPIASFGTNPVNNSNESLSSVTFD
jgi:hypothetical protein